MDIDLLCIPWDSGHRRRRMGQGPVALLEAGLCERLARRGHAVRAIWIEPEIAFPAEIETGFALMRMIAARVGESLAAGRFPLLLGGNCNQTLGGLAGLGSPDTSLVWLDAHGDFHTPETSDSGFLDGMGLAVAAGHCWRQLAASIPGFRPLPERRILHLGARDLDPPEVERFVASQIGLLPAEALAGPGADERLGAALGRLGGGAGYLHVDLDVHDARFAPANGFHAAGGLAPDRVREIVAEVARAGSLRAAYVGSYDPAVDPEGRALAVALTLVEDIASLA